MSQTLSRKDLHHNPFHQHTRGSDSHSGERRELHLMKKLHTNIHMLHDSPSLTPWHLKDNRKSIKLSSRVADGEKFFSLSKLNYYSTAGLKTVRYSCFLTTLRKILGENFNQILKGMVNYFNLDIPWFFSFYGESILLSWISFYLELQWPFL